MDKIYVLEKLAENNEYPIVFLGSGIPKRYSENFPSWEQLLKAYWDEINENSNFYAYLNSLRADIESQYPGIKNNELDYRVNIKAGTEISNQFNSLYFKEKVRIDNFTQEDAYRTKISPFKKAIANRFHSYRLKNEMSEEFELFKKMLNKTQIILTTNYDSLIEDAFNDESAEPLKKYIGQRGFFEDSIGWAELYKIHGSAERPESIIIDSADYDFFNHNSVLISAKIISLLLNSPIIFMGYSLTDMNIRKIIRDFSTSMTPMDMKSMGSRIIIVEWEEEEDGVTEQVIHDNDLQCEYTLLRTNNFSLIYDYLLKVDQGVHPSEVRKYQHIIKRLVVDNGKKGSLNSLLIAPQELDEIENRIGDERLVVALGDTTYIFDMPSLLSYIDDYIYDKNEIHTDIALRFLATQTKISRIPFHKHVRGVNIDRTNISPEEQEKIRQRIDRYSDLDNTINSVNDTYKIEKTSLNQILEEDNRKDREVELINYNFRNLGIEEVEEYIKRELEDYKEKATNKLPTSFRRLLLIYDLYKYKED